MDDAESPTPGKAMAGGDRNAGGAINFAAVVLGGLGLVTLLQAAVLATGFGRSAASGGLLTIVGVGSGIVRAAVAVAVGSLDLAVAVGLFRVERAAYWAGLVLFGLHAVLGVLAIPAYSLVAVLAAVPLFVQYRSFRRAA